MLYSPLSFPLLYLQAQIAFRYAARREVPGLEFAYFGMKLGYRLLVRRSLAGLSYLLPPVNIVRYFELPSALSCLAKPPGR